MGQAMFARQPAQRAVRACSSRITPRRAPAGGCARATARVAEQQVQRQAHSGRKPTSSSRCAPPPGWCGWNPQQRSQPDQPVQRQQPDAWKWGWPSRRAGGGRRSCPDSAGGGGKDKDPVGAIANRLVRWPPPLRSRGARRCGQQRKGGAFCAGKKRGKLFLRVCPLPLRCPRWIVSRDAGNWAKLGKAPSPAAQGGSKALPH